MDTFVAVTHMVIKWLVNVAFFGVICAIIWDLYIDYSSSAVRRAYAMWLSHSFRSI